MIEGLNDVIIAQGTRTHVLNKWQKKNERKYSYDITFVHLSFGHLLLTFSYKEK